MQKCIYRLVSLTFTAFFILSFVFLRDGFSANFTVRPIRIFFDGTNKTNILTIKNEAREDLTLQLWAYAWGQDEKGEDLYSPTKDIIFFPKILTIKKEEEKIIRLGSKIPQGEYEKTYRLYIEEILTPAPIETTAVRIIMKVGVPIFISPIKTEAKANIEKIEMLKGTLYIQVKNEGNIHFVIRAINVHGRDALGEEVFKTEIGGGYLHSGKSKGLTMEIPKEKCLKINNIEVNIATDRLSIGKKLDVGKEMCTP